MKDILVNIVQMITHPITFFESLKGINSHKKTILCSIIVGLITFIVRFGIHLPAYPRPSVLASCLVIFPVLVILVNLGTGYLCFIGWRAIGSKEKYSVAHACVAYINLMIPLTVIMNTFFVFAVSITVNYLLAIFYYTVATISTHSISPKKAVISVVSVSVVQIGIFTLLKG